MKNRAIIPLVLGLVVGLLAIKFSVNAIQRARGSSAPAVEVDVVVASQDIHSSVRITSDMVVLKKTPKSPLMPFDACTSIDKLVGRVTQKFIPAGTPIAATLMAPEGTMPGIEERIPEGYRAVSVNVDESTGVAYLVRPGCFVDVLVVMDIKRPDRKPETISRVLLQRVRVGAVGQTLSDATSDTGASKVRSVTLIVPEEDVPKLHLAQTKGKVTLAMRSEDDVMVTDKAQARQGELWGEKPAEPADTSLVGPVAPSAIPGAPTTESEVKKDVSAMVTVVNNTPGRAADVFRMIFKGVDSMDILGIKKGLTEGDSGATYAPQPQTPPVGGVGRQPVIGESERRLRRLGAEPADSGAEADYSEASSEEVGE